MLRRGHAHRPVLTQGGKGAGDLDLVAVRAAPEREPARGQGRVGRRRLHPGPPGSAARLPHQRDPLAARQGGEPRSLHRRRGFHESEQDLRRAVARTGERGQRRQGRLVVVVEPEAERLLEAGIVLARDLRSLRHAAGQERDETDGECCPVHGGPPEASP
jgi:hypothetical protein